MTPHFSLPTDPSDSRIEIRRSARRRRTVSAREEDGRVVVLMPAGLPETREHELITSMLVKLGRSRRRSTLAASDEDLADRAAALSTKYLGGRASPTSVRWVSAMSTRWASATPADGTIRISESLLHVP